MHIPSIVGSQTQQLIAGSTAKTVSGFSLIAEDGNPLPGLPRVQSEVFMAAGKTYDVMINVPAAGSKALPVYDRELSLSGNETARDSGMLAYIGINGTQPPVTSSLPPAPAVAMPDSYAIVAGQSLTVSDQSRGVIANDFGVYEAQLLAAPAHGAVQLNANGTFAYYPTAGTAFATDTFTYCANGTVKAGVCSSGISTTVSLGPTTVADAGITCSAPPAPPATSFASNMARTCPSDARRPAFCKDAAGLPITVKTSAVTATGMTVHADVNGGFIATAPSAGTYTASFPVVNAKGQTATASVTILFPAGSGLAVSVVDGKTKAAISDYRWIIEEDRTFYIDPTKTTNTCALGATCPVVPTFGTNFHTSYMPLVATGCTGPLSCESGQSVGGVAAVCDVGNGVCRPGTQQTAVNPSQVHLDPTKRYYISVLPGDAANSFENVNSCLGNATPSCGHGMGGAPITIHPATHLQTTPVNMIVQSNQFQQ
jgi:hypothetical protein